MELENVGYNLKTGYHDKRLTRLEGVFVGIVWVDHVGKENKISANHFATRFAAGMGVDIFLDRQALEHWKRDIRRLHNHILFKHDKIPIHSKAGYNGGYWIAETEEEAEEFYRAFRNRGMTGLIKATRGKKAAMVDAVEQLTFEFDDLVDKTEGVISDMPRKKETVAPDIVDALLGKMTREPEIFASNLRKIKEKYFSGAVLLEKDKLAAMRAKTKELQEMIGGLE